jgi:DNA-binding response OmpR family regulator
LKKIFIMKKIILIEDDPDIRGVTLLVLERAGYSVMVFDSGEPLLEGRYDVPDLFILDKQLSGVDGLDVCRFLKGQDSTKTVPVVMLSASPNIELQSRQAGADDFLEKPFSTKTLREMVAKHTI